MKPGFLVSLSSLFPCFLVSSSRGKSCVLPSWAPGHLAASLRRTWRRGLRSGCWVPGPKGSPRCSATGFGSPNATAACGRSVSRRQPIPPRFRRLTARLLLVKSYQIERAAAWAATVLRPDGLAVTFQNGLDNGPKLTAAVGTERAAVGVNYTGATLLGPGETRHTAQLTNLIGTSPASGGACERAVRPADSRGVEHARLRRDRGRGVGQGGGECGDQPPHRAVAGAQRRAAGPLPNAGACWPILSPRRRLWPGRAASPCRWLTRWRTPSISAGSVRRTTRPCSRTSSTAGRPRSTASTA